MDVNRPQDSDDDDDDRKYEPTRDFDGFTGEEHEPFAVRAKDEANASDVTPCGSAHCTLGFACPDAVCECKGGTFTDPSCDHCNERAKAAFHSFLDGDLTPKVNVLGKRPAADELDGNESGSSVSAFSPSSPCHDEDVGHDDSPAGQTYGQSGQSGSLVESSNPAGSSKSHFGNTDYGSPDDDDGLQVISPELRRKMNELTRIRQVISKPSSCVLAAQVNNMLEYSFVTQTQPNWRVIAHDGDLGFLSGKTHLVHRHVSDTVDTKLASHHGPLTTGLNAQTAEIALFKAVSLSFVPTTDNPPKVIAHGDDIPTVLHVTPCGNPDCLNGFQCPDALCNCKGGMLMRNCCKDCNKCMVCKARCGKYLCCSLSCILSVDRLDLGFSIMDEVTDVSPLCPISGSLNGHGWDMFRGMFDDNHPREAYTDDDYAACTCGPLVLAGEITCSCGCNVPTPFTADEMKERIPGISAAFMKILRASDERRRMLAIDHSNQGHAPSTTPRSSYVCSQELNPIYGNGCAFDANDLNHRWKEWDGMVRIRVYEDKQRLDFDHYCSAVKCVARLVVNQYGPDYNRACSIRYHHDPKWKTWRENFVFYSPDPASALLAAKHFIMEYVSEMSYMTYEPSVTSGHSSYFDFKVPTRPVGTPPRRPSTPPTTRYNINDSVIDVSTRPISVNPYSSEEEGCTHCFTPLFCSNQAVSGKRCSMIGIMCTKPKCTRTEIIADHAKGCTGSFTTAHSVDHNIFTQNDNCIVCDPPVVDLPHALLGHTLASALSARQSEVSTRMGDFDYHHTVLNRPPDNNVRIFQMLLTPTEPYIMEAIARADQRMGPMRPSVQSFYDRGLHSPIQASVLMVARSRSCGVPLCSADGCGNPCTFTDATNDESFDITKYCTWECALSSQSKDLYKEIEAARDDSDVWLQTAGNRSSYSDEEINKALTIVKSLASQRAAMPIDGMITERLLTKLKGRQNSTARAVLSVVPPCASLFDDGASVYCAVNGIGRLMDTFDASDAGDLTVGEEGATLKSNGSYLHAITQHGADGTKVNMIRKFLDTPTSICTIMSEGGEVNIHGGIIQWAPGSPRQIKYPDGQVLKLHMGASDLGYARTTAINDDELVQSLLVQYHQRRIDALERVNAVISAPVEVDKAQMQRAKSALSIDTRGDDYQPEYQSLADLADFPVQAKLNGALAVSPALYPVTAVHGLKWHSVLSVKKVLFTEPPLLNGVLAVEEISTDQAPVNVSANRPDWRPPVGVGLARAPMISGLEILIRLHVVLGHCSLARLLATLATSVGLKAGKVTKADIEAYVKHGCGICDSTKMKRRPFKSLKDKTKPPIGVSWAMDSLSLRVPSAQHNFLYINRFVDRGSGKRRSYGSLTLTADTLAEVIHLHRAFVRPDHGEIHVFKSDGLPALRSYKIIEVLRDCEMRKDMSPAYIHEGVGEVEITFLHDVPSAVAMLRQAARPESHFYTSFLHAEKAGNRVVDPVTGQSRDMIYYGRTADCLTSMIAYGSPCKTLVHPEIRVSKFDDHAVPGWYAGPSREDESEQRCWIWIGQGATGKYATCDIGCSRFDERQVLARCDRNHPTLQPHALDQTVKAPVPDFSRWHDNANQSRASTYVWTYAGVQPDQEYVLYLCGGHSREGDVESHIHDITNGRVMTVVIDPARGGYQHCIELEPVLAGIQLLIQNELCVAMIHTRPCSPWSGLRCLRPGPPMLFDLDNLYGIKDANGMYSQTTVDARLIGDAIASCIRTATSCNRTCLGEGPVGRGRDSPYAIKGQETHAGVWSYPPVASALVNGNQTEIIADLGKAGAKSPKTTAFFVTEDILPAAQLELGTLKMPDHSPQMESMVGADATGTYRSNATAFFSTETSRRVAKAIMHAWLIARNATPGYGALPPDSVGGGGMQSPDQEVPDQQEVEYAFTDPQDDDYQPFVEVPDEIPASRSRPRRESSNAKYDKEGHVLTIGYTSACTSSPCMDGCGADGVALTILAGRNAMSAIMQSAISELEKKPVQERTTAVIDDCMAAAVLTITNPIKDDFKSPPQSIDLVINAIEIGKTNICLKHLAIAVVDGMEVSTNIVNNGDFNSWHVPTNEREYKDSPQKALWDTAKELKMDEYKKLRLFKLIPRSEALKLGFVIHRSLWAYSVKTDGKGKFEKMNPRWCLCGGRMDRDIYESFADTMRSFTLKFMCALRGHYHVITFQFDVGNAFQTTRTDEDDSQPRLFTEQANGFVEYGANGERLVAEVLAAMQGRIDSARIFRYKFRADLIKLGSRPCLWDPNAYELHIGPLSTSASNLEQILAACNSAPQPPINGAPPGWMFFGIHVDDGPGICSIDGKLRDWLMRELIKLGWKMKCHHWMKVLGFTPEIDEKEGTCGLSAYPTVQAMAREHLGDSLTFSPKHPYAMSIGDLVCGEAPDEKSPEHAAYKLIMSKQRSLQGAGIWVSQVYPGILFANNFLCGFMHSPTEATYKACRHWLAHLLAFPMYPRWGTGIKRHLVMSNDPKPPFEGPIEYGYYVCADASLPVPKNTIPQSANRSFTGVVDMYGAAAVDITCVRQHLTSPDSHTAEIVAASTAQHGIVPKRGLQQEIHIPSADPTILYCDSQSAVFVAEENGRVRRSAWVLRRAAVLREGAELGDCKVIKIGEANNIADGFTKPIKHEVWKRHMNFICGIHSET